MVTVASAPVAPSMVRRPHRFPCRGIESLVVVDRQPGLVARGARLTLGVLTTLAEASSNIAGGRRWSDDVGPLQLFAPE
jgi:hypothetical protein